MAKHRNSRLGRALALTAAVLALSACTVDVDGVTESAAKDAGRKYGEAMVDKLGARTTTKELKSLCGQGARTTDFLPDTDVDEAAQADVDAFVEGCREAVTEN
jgi:hypothetical protein